MTNGAENPFPAVLLRTAVVLALAAGGGAVHAQQSDEPAAETGTAQPAIEAPADERVVATEDEELEEIVLQRQEFFEEEPYLEGVNEDILDTDVETDAERLSRLFTLYLDAISERMYAEADALGKQIVELTISSFGLDSEESAKALTNLAIAQHGIEDYESAILNYEAAIGIIERVENRLSYDLINPLRGLGAAQLASGRPDLARDSFNRAVHVSHVNEGPHNLEQIETLESLAETFLSVGEYDEAVDIQKRIYYLQARNVDTDSMDIIPALRTRASWQHRLQLYEQERFTWRRIISIIEDNRGKENLELIDPLTQLGNSYLFVGFSDSPYAQTASISSGEIYLKRAVRVAEDNEDAGWEILTDAMLNLGDYYMLSARPNRAQNVYEDVWQLLSRDSDPNRLTERAAELESAVVLQNIAPPKMYGGEPSVPVVGVPPGFETGTVVYEYIVSTRGQPTDIRLKEADPVGLDDMYQSIARDVRGLMYRPRFQDGEATATEDVTYQHTFYYRESDLPEKAAAAQTDGADST